MLSHFDSMGSERGVPGMQRESECGAGQRVEGRKANYCGDVTTEV